VGKHAAVINGMYEPSPSELCGGWPVYYNNSSLRNSDVKATKSGLDLDGDITKSFLLFCPYAMSWAITVLASVNDVCGQDSADVHTAIGDGGAESRGNGESSAPATGTSDLSPTGRLPLPLALPLDQDKISKLAVIKSTAAALPFYTPSSAPLTLAFFEVSANTQPELAHGTSTWKVSVTISPEHHLDTFCIRTINSHISFFFLLQYNLFYVMPLRSSLRITDYAELVCKVLITRNAMNHIRFSQDLSSSPNRP
jgi:hypothetical protein